MGGDKLSPAPSRPWKGRRAATKMPSLRSGPAVSAKRNEETQFKEMSSALPASRVQRLVSLASRRRRGENLPPCPIQSVSRAKLAHIRRHGPPFRQRHPAASTRSVGPPMSTHRIEGLMTRGGKGREGGVGAARGWSAEARRPEEVPSGEKKGAAMNARFFHYHIATSSRICSGRGGLRGAGEQRQWRAAGVRRGRNIGPHSRSPTKPSGGLSPPRCPYKRAAVVAPSPCLRKCEMGGPWGAGVHVGESPPPPSQGDGEGERSHVG